MGETLVPTLDTSSASSGLVRELDLWSRAGIVATFWIRDDDACEVTPQLQRLSELAERHGVEIALAVVPGKLQIGLLPYLRQRNSPFHPMCHGWKHVDYGPSGKPGEFGPDRPPSAVHQDAVSAFQEFTVHFGADGVVFVPPYGRITPELVEALPEIGFLGVSAGPANLERRLARVMTQISWLPSVPIGRERSVAHFDVHIDPFDWMRNTARPSNAVCAEIVGHLRLRRNGIVPRQAPIGLLMHHLVHDEAMWSLCDGLVGALSKHSAVQFPAVSGIVGAKAPRQSKAVAATRPAK
jgi:hypothetical protein